MKAALAADARRRREAREREYQRRQLKVQREQGTGGRSREGREAWRKLDLLGATGNLQRVRNRCTVTGRGRGVSRRFRRNRREVRSRANRGELAGLRKVSW